MKSLTLHRWALLSLIFFLSLPSLKIYTNSFILIFLSFSIDIHSSCAAVNFHSTFHYKPSKNNIFYKTQLK